MLYKWSWMSDVILQLMEAISKVDQMLLSTEIKILYVIKTTVY